MPALTLENFMVLLIVTIGLILIILILIFCLQKFFKILLYPLIAKPRLRQSAYQDFDFRDSFYDHGVANEAFPSNYQTINIYSMNPPPQVAPSINISLKSLNKSNNKDVLNNSMIEENDKMERLVNYANNFCRSSYNLKWKNKLLNKIGSRSSKLSFLITYKLKDDYQPALFSFIPVTNCKLKLDEIVIKNGVKNLCENIKHPNIQSLLKIDVEPNLKMCIVVKPLETCSVKDLIYNNKDCKLSYQKKYEIKNIGKPLELSLISLIGRQILLGLHYLHSIGFYHNNIHSGNIYIKNNKAMIGELENYVLNLPSKNRKTYEKILIQEKNFDKERFESPQEIIDIIQFGQLLYEMMTGCELKMLKPDPNDYIFIPRPIANILKQIFPDNDEVEEKTKMSLTLKSILENSNIDASYFSENKGQKKNKFLPPKIRVEELLYEEFFRDEEDPFYKKYADIPKFQDQITKGIIKQLNRLNYSNK